MTKSVPIVTALLIACRVGNGGTSPIANKGGATMQGAVESSAVIAPVPFVEGHCVRVDEQGDVHNVDGNVVPPIAVHRVSPDLSALNELQPSERRIPVVEAIVGSDGLVQEACMLQPGSPELDSRILQAVKRWRFEPATRNGEPVAVYYRLTVNINWR